MMNVRRVWLVAVGLVCVALPVAADEGRVDITEWTVRTVAGETCVGAIERFDLANGLALRTATGDVLAWPAADLVDVRRAAGGELIDASPPNPPAEWLVQLAHGDRWRGELVAGSAGRLALEAAGLGVLELPLEAVHAARRVDLDDASRRRWQSLAHQDPLRDDRVLLRNGDAVRGFVLEWSNRAITIEQNDRALPIDLGLVVSVRLAAGPPEPATGLRGRVQIDADRQLTCPSLAWRDAGQVHLASTAGPVLEVPARRIRAVEMLGGRWVWLTALRQRRCAHTPMFDLDWPCRFDRNVRGHALQVAGVTYAHGLGVHSRTLLVYDLAGEYETFVTAAGLDDDSGPWADVDLVVRVDGDARWQQTGVAPGQLHGPIRIDVTGAQTLELLADFGAHGDLQDRVDWIEPALVRPAGRP